VKNGDLSVIDPTPYNISITNVTEAFGAQTFEATFSNGSGGIVVLSATGNGGSSSDTLPFSSSSLVDVTVKKLTHGGIAQDTGFIQFKRNGIVEPGTAHIGGGTGTQTFVVTDNLGTGSIHYRFEGLSFGDTLSVEVTEG